MTPAFDDDVWELYDTSKDWTQAEDLSKKMPDKLHELQRLWLIESHAVTAEIVVPDGGGQGVIIAQGGNIGGWSLYVKGGKLKYCYNFLGLKYFYVESDKTVDKGEHQVRMEFAYDGGGLGKGGTATLYIDGKKAGEGRVEITAAAVFSADDGCDVGCDTGSAVSPDYGPRNNAFNGVVRGVQLAIAEGGKSAGPPWWTHNRPSPGF